MKCIIAGGRHGSIDKTGIEMLYKIHRMIGIDMVISGGATGIDSEAESWAKFNQISVSRHPAHWKKPDGSVDYSAGPRRNAKMARIADALIVFNGGKGTENMIKIAKRERLIIFDCRR